MTKKHYRQILVLGMSILTGSAMAQQAGMVYPATMKTDSVDDYHGVKIADPYRWLEDDHSEATAAWVKEQNTVTNAYLSRIPFRDAIRQRLSVLWNYPKTGAPFREGEYYYYYKNDGLQNQSVLYRQKGLDGKPEVFLDPNKLSASGTTALGSVSFSRDHRYVAYLLSGAGSDWQQAFVMDVATRELLPDKLEWIKFSGLSWKGDGFYYSRYDAPGEKNRLSQKNEFHKVYYHRLGTSQEQDELVFVDKDHPLRNANVAVTEDERFLILHTTEGTSGAEIWYRDLQDAGQKDFKLLIKGFDFQPGVIDNIGGKLLVHTNHDAPNYKIVLVDPAHPEKENWETIVPEKPEVLSSAGMAAGRLFVGYLKDASERMYQYEIRPGAKATSREVVLPGIGSVSGFNGKKDDKFLFYSFSSYTTPGTIYKYDVATGKSTLYTRPTLNFNPDEYETRQVFFNSKDGTRIPIFLSYKKGMQQQGNNPVRALWLWRF